MAQTTVVAPKAPAAAPWDRYALRKQDILNPPHGWGASLKFLGPGMIMTASIVGSGELIATTTAGATAGFVLLWMVLFSCAVKVALQVELARYVISTGVPTLEAFNKVPPKFGRLSWTNWAWMIFAMLKWIQSAGILGGVAQVFQIWFPISNEVWTGVIVFLTITLLFSAAYGFIEKVAFYLVVFFSLVTVIIAVGLPLTPWGYSPTDIAAGFSFAIPAGAVAVAVGMFGITGVGADEITMYPYWCLEKGYARWTGPADGTQAWLDRARGWINVMQKDVWVAFVIYTFATAAFFLMGASVLHRQGLQAEGFGMVTTLSRMYTDTLGPWAQHIFLLGAAAVLGSTLWAMVPSWSRMWTNWMGELGIINWKNPKQRLNVIRLWTIFLPVVWGAAYLWIKQPVQMVIIGGIATGTYLVVVVIAVWYLRQTYTDSRLRGGAAFTLLLLLSSLAIGFLGVYSIMQQFGFKIG